jgi:5-methylcytosine-specific restriction enzyme A
MTAKSTFIIGKSYRRQSLHDQIGGQRQGGISTPQAEPLILLFTGDTGKQYGYHDGMQPDGTFWYTGEGQEGDMQWVRGNRAIRDHHADGKTLHLFEQASRGQVGYIGEAEYLSHHETTAPDRNGTQRKVIVFELALLGDDPTAEVPSLGVAPQELPREFQKMSLEQLRSAALRNAARSTTPSERKAIIHQRSEAIKAYVKRRANGVCEACGHIAPFPTMAGEPYLEPHHVRRLADGGPDHPRWVAAICPTCHRLVHYGRDGKALNDKIAEYLGTKEA